MNRFWRLLTVVSIPWWLACASAECPDCPILPNYTKERGALIDLYDWNADGCVREAEDMPAHDALFGVRGGTAFNSWRIILGQCLSDD